MAPLTRVHCFYQGRRQAGEQKEDLVVSPFTRRGPQSPAGSWQMREL